MRAVTETYQNGTSWYRIYSDGWCEQGGISLSSGNNGSSSGNANITFLLEFADVNYNIQATCQATSAGSWLRVGSWNYITKSTGSVTGNSRHVNEGGSSNHQLNIDWVACGYIR